MSDEEKELAIVVREPTDIFQKFDSLDDEAIVAEIEGRLTDQAVYHFDQGGKPLWGIGKVGVDWCVTELAKKGYIVRDEQVTYNVDPTAADYVLFTATVAKFFVDKEGREARVDQAIGNKRQWTKMARRDGSVQVDPFWFEKGAQKALRNARLRLIPEEVKAKIIAAAKDKGKVKEVKAAPKPEPSGDDPGDNFEEHAEPEVPKHKTITIKLYSGKSVTEDLTAIYKRFENIKKELGDGPYHAILGQFGYEKKNQIPYARIPDVYTGLLGAIKLGIKEPKK